MASKSCSGRLVSAEGDGGVVEGKITTLCGLVKKSAKIDKPIVRMLPSAPNFVYWTSRTRCSLLFSHWPFHLFFLYLRLPCFFSSVGCLTFCFRIPKWNPFIIDVKRFHPKKRRRRTRAMDALRGWRWQTSAGNSAEVGKSDSSGCGSDDDGIRKRSVVFCHVDPRWAHSVII